MSDGDNATPGRHGQDGSSAPDGQSDAYQWHTRSAAPLPGATPNNHTDGITVADLIAKLNGASPVPPDLKRHQPETSPPPPAPPTEVIDAVADAQDTQDVQDAGDFEDFDTYGAYDTFDTEIMPAIGAQSELPDLTLAHRTR